MDTSSLLTIKEFSRFSGVSQTALRYYDEIGLLTPAARGENNYRYYTPLQTMTVSFISVLVDAGVPLAAINEIAEHRTPEAIRELLAGQDMKLTAKMRELLISQSVVHVFLNKIQAGLRFRSLSGQIMVEGMEETHVILGDVTQFEEGESYFREFMRFCDSAEDNRINLRYPIGGYYEDIEAFFKAPSHPTRFFSLDPFGNTKREAGQYMIAYVTGHYGEFGDLPQRMAAYARERDLDCDGPLYILYILDEVSIPDPTQYLARVIVSVRRSRKKKIGK